MEKCKNLALVVLLIGFLICAFGLVDTVYRIKNEQQFVTVRDTVWKTEVRREPAVHDTVTVYTRLERMPKVEQKSDGTLVVRDTVLVQVKDVQVHYKDTLYEAWVSGYKPRLDSIKLSIPNVRERVTVKQKKQRFGIGPHVGMGVNGNGVYPYVGVGLQYNMIRF